MMAHTHHTKSHDDDDDDDDDDDGKVANHAKVVLLI